MFLIGQLPGVDEAIDAAKAHGHSYEAILVIIGFAGAIGALVFMIKKLFTTNEMEREASKAREERILLASKEREDRMATRITLLEDMIRSIQEQHTQAMMEIAKSTTEAMTKNEATLGKICTVLAKLDATLDKHDTQIATLLQQLQDCPCLLLGKYRDRVSIVDKETGQPVTLADLQAGE